MQVVSFVLHLGQLQNAVFKSNETNVSLGNENVPYLVCRLIFRDGDGVPDAYDNCLDLPNGEQADADNDTIGTSTQGLSRK